MQSQMLEQPHASPRKARCRYQRSSTSRDTLLRIVQLVVSSVVRAYRCVGPTFAAIVLCSACEDGGETRTQLPSASVWITTADQLRLLESQDQVAFVVDEAASQLLTIDIDETQRFQTMGGFGASLTDSSAWLITMRMNAEQRAALLQKLFDAQAGIGLSTLRHPIGASDFAISSYTFNDRSAGQSDPQLEHFSIDHDLEYIIPLLLQVRALNPQLKIIGTAWTAPAWMKTSGSLIGGSLRAEHYGSYADYLVRYVQAFAAEGVPITAIAPVNEPLFEAPSYPGMLMDAVQQIDFVKNHLGPAVRRAGLATQIIIYDHNWDRPDYPMAVLNDMDARSYVTGTAFHCYAGDVSAQTPVHDLHPDKAILVTECSGTVGSPFDGDLRWAMRNLFIGATRRWATDVLAWNLALDEGSGPQNGGCRNCRGVVTIEQATGAVTYNVEYYALGHASLAARPGAIRIASTTFDGALESVAFLNPDSSKGLIVLNNMGVSETFRVHWSGLAFSYTLPAGAVATFRWP
jgi:glucosylceramidase